MSKFFRFAFAIVALVALQFAPGASLAANISPTTIGTQSASGQALPKTLVTHVLTNGAALDVGWADTLTQGFLLLGTDNTNGVASAFITATQLNFDPSSQVCIPDPVLGLYCHYTRVSYDAIYANVNPSDLSLSDNAARLVTDLRSATNVTFTRCVYDEINVTTVCTDMASTGGLINLQWRKTNTDYVKSIGVTETKSGPHIVRVTGSRASYSAETSGSVVGTLVQHKAGTMGTSKTLTVDVLRGP